MTDTQKAFEEWVFSYLVAQFPFYRDEIIKSWITKNNSNVSCLRDAWQDAHASRDAEVKELVGALENITGFTSIGFVHNKHECIVDARAVLAKHTKEQS